MRKITKLVRRPPRKRPPLLYTLRALDHAGKQIIMVLNGQQRRGDIFVFTVGKAVATASIASASSETDMIHNWYSGVRCRRELGWGRTQGGPAIERRIRAGALPGSAWRSRCSQLRNESHSRSILYSCLDLHVDWTEQDRIHSSIHEKAKRPARSN